MYRVKDTTNPHMTEAHWRLLQTAVGQVLIWASKAPSATAPWDRPEWHDRRTK